MGKSIKKKSMKLYFLINPKSGTQEINYETLIQRTFGEQHTVYIYRLTPHCTIQTIKTDIHNQSPDRVIAVGGDGTIKFTAECLLGTNIPLAIVPAGSANGMAREIHLKPSIDLAFERILNGTPKPIHALRVNNEFSIHLADIGLNARIIKKFEDLNERGMIGYAKATWRALKRHKRMHVTISANGSMKYRKAEMVVIANGTSYGTGIMINKTGSLFDQHFEIVIVKWLSIIELIKMCLRFKTRFNPYKTEIISAQSAYIQMRERSSMQVDGEYIGKVKDVNVKLIPNAVYLVI